MTWQWRDGRVERLEWRQVGSWPECCAAISRRHHDLVAVFESRRGRLAVLLRQTLVPLPAERSEWLRETRRAARAVIADFHQTGVHARWIVLQWRPLPVTAAVLRYWPCRYAADERRLAELRRVVQRYLDDRAFLASRVAAVVDGSRTDPPPA